MTACAVTFPARGSTVSVLASGPLPPAQYPDPVVPLFVDPGIGHVYSSRVWYVTHQSTSRSSSKLVGTASFAFEV